jgi:hypothetical protein
MTVVLMVGLALAIARVTRLLVKDALPPIKLVREWIDRHWWDYDIESYLEQRRALPKGIKRRRWFWRWIGHSIAYIWTCDWCMSVWVGLGVWAVADWATRLSVPYPWLIMAAGSLLSGWLGNLQSEHDQRYEARAREMARPT